MDCLSKAVFAVTATARLIGVGILSTLGSSQDCLNYTASFNAAAQSRREETIDAIAPRATGKIAFGANPMNDSTVTLNGTPVTFAASPSAGQVQMGSTLAATLQNLIAALEAFRPIDDIR